MRLWPARLLLAGALAGVMASAAAQVSDGRLPAPVAEALQRAGLPADALAAAVLPSARFGPRWLFQPDRPMQPGSTMKLLTSIVALDRLGPSHRGFTELLTYAPQAGDVLAGDLLLRGGADPELSLAQMWALLAELRHTQGIREIAGDIVVDRSLFRPQRPELGLPPFDEQPEFPYNVVPDALQLNGSLMRLEISSEAAAPGAEPVVTARALPPLPDLVIDASAMRLTDRACKDWDADWISPPRLDEPMPGTLRVRLQGGFPRDCTQRPSLQLIDRQALVERQLRWLWGSLGGVWTGRAREADTPVIRPLGEAARAPATWGDAKPPPPALPGSAVVTPGVARAGHQGATPAGLRLLASHVARPWGELLRTLNKQSDNVMSRLLYLSLGLPAMAENPGASTAALAERSVQRWLAERRIDGSGLVIDNGSGLSRSERLTPRQLSQALQAAQWGPWSAELLMSLPIAGVDGTLRNRLASGPAAGQARLKTGTLRNVRALAGVVGDPQGRQWTLVAMINHEQAAAGRAALDALVDWVAGGGMQQRQPPAGEVEIIIETQ